MLETLQSVLACVGALAVVGLAVLIVGAMRVRVDDRPLWKDWR